MAGPNDREHDLTDQQGKRRKVLLLAIFGTAAVIGLLLVLNLLRQNSYEPVAPSAAVPVSADADQARGASVTSQEGHNVHTASGQSGDPYDGIDFDRLVVAALRGARTAKHDKAAAAAAAETIEEKVRALMYKTYRVGSPTRSFTAGEPYLATYMNNPRVGALAKVAMEGSAAEKAELLRCLTRMCRVFLTELPEFCADADAPWKPTVMHSGGVAAYPYLLRLVDEDATALELVVRMHLWRQEVRRRVRKAASTDWVSCEIGLAFAYACDYFLAQYCARPELRAGLAAEQLRTLDAFKAHKAARGPDWNLGRRQCEVLEFAVQFVSEALKGGDGEAR